MAPKPETHGRDARATTLVAAPVALRRSACLPARERAVPGGPPVLPLALRRARNYVSLRKAAPIALGCLIIQRLPPVCHSATGRRHCRAPPAPVGRPRAGSAVRSDRPENVARCRDESHSPRAVAAGGSAPARRACPARRPFAPPAGRRSGFVRFPDNAPENPAPAAAA